MSENTCPNRGPAAGSGAAASAFSFSSAGNDPLVSSGKDSFSFAGNDLFSSAGEESFSFAGNDPFSSAGEDSSSSAEKNSFSSDGKSPFSFDRKNSFSRHDQALKEAQERFDTARTRIISLTPRERHGIGMQSEKTLHAVLKYYMDPVEDHHEIPIDNYIADIYDDGRIIEVQTAHLDAMRAKLACFLPQYPVRIVYPIPAEKWIVWVDPDTGELQKRNRSPLRGHFLHAFRELYKIRPFLPDPNLSIELLLIDLDEYRLLDGWSRDRKRGSHRYERIPLRLRDRLILTCPQDYMQFLPPDLEEPFTSAQLAAASGCRKTGASTVTLLLMELGVLERVGKQGRSWLYRITDRW